MSRHTLSSGCQCLIQWHIHCQDKLQSTLKAILNGFFCFIRPDADEVRSGRSKLLCSHGSVDRRTKYLDCTTICAAGSSQLLQELDLWASQGDDGCPLTVNTSEPRSPYSSIKTVRLVQRSAGAVGGLKGFASLDAASSSNSRLSCLGQTLSWPRAYKIKLGQLHELVSPEAEEIRS